MDLKKWFNETILQKTLNILNGLADKFKDEQGKPDWRKVVQVFSQFCDNSLDLSPTEQEALDDVIYILGLTDEVDSLRAFWQKIPGQLRDFTKSLESFSDPVTWKVLGKGGKELDFGSLAGPLESPIFFKANAETDMSFQSLDADAAQNALDMTCEANERYLRIGLFGRLEVNLGMSGEVGFLGITGSTDAAGTTSLDYYYLDKGKWLFGEALVHNVPHLVPPFDAAAVVAKEAHRLRAIQLQVVGSLNTSVDLNVGKTWGATFNIAEKSLDLNSDVSVEATVNAGFQAGLQMSGAWNVLVKQKEGQVLSVKVQKKQSKGKTASLSVESGLDVSGLDAVGDALIKKYLPDPGGLLDKLDRFSNFGSLLKEEVKEYLEELLKVEDDDTLVNELINVVVGDNDAAGLADAMGSAAEEALNNRLDLLIGSASDAGRKITRDMAERLKLPEKLGEKLVDKAEGEMNKLLGNIKGKLLEKLQTIIEANKGHLEKLFKPLELVGEKVTEFSAEVDKLSQQLLEPVISLLTKYQKQRNKVVKVVRDSARLRLQLQASRTFAHTSENTPILDFEVDTGEEKSRKYYKEMLVGKFSNALAAARKSDNGSDGIKLTGGSFKYLVQRNLTTDVNVNILGAQIKDSTILDSKVEVQLDTAGNIMMADSKGTMDKAFSAFGESREVSFINMMEIPGSVSTAAAEESDDARTPVTKLFTSSLNLSYRDKVLKKSELEAYLGSLQKTGLVSGECLTAVVDRYDELLEKARSEKKKMGGEIGLALPLTSRHIEILMDSKDEDIELTAIRNQVKIYLNDPEKRAAFNKILGKWYDRSGDETAQIKKIAAAGKLGDALIRYDIPNIDTRREQTTVPARERHYIRIAHQIGTNAANLVDIIQKVRDAAKIQFQNS
jgi:hypothetical protein